MRDKYLERTRSGPAPAALLAAIIGLCLLVPSIAHALSFDFTLAHAGRTSAGVFKADGTLVRTLWSGESFPVGSFTRTWDGIDDLGHLAPDGTYEVRVLSSQTTYTWQGVLGNTSDDGTGPGVFHFWGTIADMAISGTTAFIATGYGEAIAPRARFETNDIGTKTAIAGLGENYIHVATDGVRVYWAVQSDDQDDRYGYVTATDAATDQPVTFGTATKIDNVDVCFADATPSGLAVQKDNDYLFISRTKMDSIHVVDKVTGAFVRNISLTEPTGLSVDEDDDEKIWIIHTTGGLRVVERFDIASDGSLSPASPPLRIESPAILWPLAIANRDGKILVVDGDTSQTVKAFDSSATLLWDLDDDGGYVGTPTVSNTRFDFEPGLKWTTAADVAFQPDGSFWVADPGCYRVQHFSSSGVFIDNIAYVPSSYSTAVDPNDPTRVFADFLEFGVDYDLELGPGNASWTLVRNWRASSVDADKQDSFGAMKYVTTLESGSESHTYAFAYYADAEPLEYVTIARLIELTETGVRDTDVSWRSDEGPIPALFPDGSLRYVTNAGQVEVWKERAFAGFDSSENPTWATETTVASAPLTSLDPDEFMTPGVARPGNKTSGDVVVAYDYTYIPKPEYAHVHHAWHLGGVKAGTNQWLWRAAHVTPVNYSGDWPGNGMYEIGNGVEGTGGAVMSVGPHIFTGYRGDNWKGGQANVFSHFYEDGLFVDDFGGLAPYGHAEAPEGVAGNSASAWIVQLSDGRTYIYQADESHHGGVHRWKVGGLDTVQEEKISVALQNDVVAGLSAEYFDTPDLNNRYRTSVRWDAAINFDWTSGLPAETGVTSNDSISVRWSGFVVPQYSETYEFAVETEEGDAARLWVNGKELLASSSPPYSIALTAGVYYPIRVEYQHDTGDASVVLKWASTSQSEQVVPGTRLFTALPAGDLMQGLPSSGTIANNTAGWTRYPTSDATSSYSHLWAVGSTQSSGNPYLDIYFRDVSDGAYGDVVRDLGTPSDTMTRWDLSMMINYEGGYPNHGTAGGQYLEVLDDADKVIARFYPIQVAFPSDARVYGNGEVIVQTDVATMNSDIMGATWRPLRITGENGQITFQYGSYAKVTASLMDGTANWRRAKKLKVHAFTAQSWAAYDRKVKIDGLRMVTDSNSTTEELMDGLPSSGAVANGTVGWTRWPATNVTSSYWDQWLVNGNLAGEDPYLDVLFRNNTSATSGDVARELGTPSDTTTRWELSLSINYEGGYPNHGTNGGHYVDVLDDADKVIARFYPTQVAFPGDARFYGNGSVIVQTDVSTLMNTIMYAWRPLRISAEAGQISFTYDGYSPVTTSVFDGTANWRRAKTLRVHAFTAQSWAAYDRVIKIDDVQWTRFDGSHTTNLLADLPADSTLAEIYGGGVGMSYDRYGWSVAAENVTGIDGGAILDIKTNLKTVDRVPAADVGVKFRQSGDGQLLTFSRDLGVPDDSTARWELKMLVQYEQPNHGDMPDGGAGGYSGGQYLEVLDDENLTIARFYPKATGDVVGKAFGNDTVVREEPDIGAFRQGWKPLTILAQGGQVTFKYGTSPAVTTAVNDAGADWRRAKVLRLRFWNANHGPQDRFCFLDDLTYSVSR